MPSYKLIYFNTRGRGEIIRLLFAAAGVKYEDCRLSGEEFAKLKASGKLPYGQLPVLECDGKILAQTSTIIKYVGSKIDLAPTDSFQLARAGMVVDGMLEMMGKAVQFIFEKDEEKKKALGETFFGKTLPDSLAIHEKLLEANDKKHFAGDKMTFADIMFFACLDSLSQDRKEDIPATLNNFPLLKDLFSRVLANPGIKEWLKKRPVVAM